MHVATRPLRHRETQYSPLSRTDGSTTKWHRNCSFGVNLTMSMEARPHMTTLYPRIGTLFSMALLLVVSWPMSVSAEEEGEVNDKVRVAVIDFENNST